MCVACTDSAVTGLDVCTGRLVRMCAACTDDSAVTGCDVFTGSANLRLFISAWVLCIPAGCVIVLV